MQPPIFGSPSHLILYSRRHYFLFHVLERGFVQSGVSRGHINTKVDYHYTARPLGDVRTIHPPFEDFRIGAAVRIRLRYPFGGNRFGDVKVTYLAYPLKGYVPVIGQSLRQRQVVSARGQVSVDFCDCLASSARPVSLPSPKQIIDVCTVAPSNIQSLSDMTANISPFSLMRPSARRFDWNRIACVASRPARLAAPISICARAFSNQ